MKWLGDPITTWEPTENLFNVMDMVDEYKAKIKQDKKGKFVFSSLLFRLFGRIYCLNHFADQFFLQ